MAYTASPIPLSYEDHYRLCSILPAATTKIITAARARLYEAPFGAPESAWTPTGLKGVVVFGYDATSRSSRHHTTNYWFRLVDLRRNKILWLHEVQELVEYEAEKPFFHVFGGRVCTTYAKATPTNY
jgi:neural Wiskott-Aldrich syndrome protein